MRFILSTLVACLIAASAVSTVSAFVTPPSLAFLMDTPSKTDSRRSKTTTTSPLFATNSDPKGTLVSHMAKQMAAALILGSTFWASPAAIAPMFPSTIVADGVAHAKDKASGSGSRVNKDPESLLRYGLPIQNNEVS